MTLDLDQSFFRALPKVELHAHLSGSISRDTLHAIWLHKQALGQCLTLEDPLTAIRTGSEGFVDVNTFFPLFDKYIYALCNEVSGVQYATQEVIKGFERDGVRYLELRTTPRECITTGMSKADYIRAVGEIIITWNRTNRERLEVYLILSIDRKMSAQQAAEVIDLAIDHQYRPNKQDGYVVAVDLCGDPAKGDVSIFTSAFSRAQSHGLGITVHFAEIPQSSTASELETILSWKPDRLGHCIHVPARIADIIEERRIGVELCLSCNVLASLTSGGYSKHHLREWLQRTCSIALSTDDVGIFGSSLSNEYMVAAQYFLNAKMDVIRLSKGAVEVAFAGRQRMMRLLEAFAGNISNDKAAV